jgi:23S rRNA (pseudouridine1915-N3)-methyltransferase
MRVIAVGRLRDGPEAELFARYNARLRPRIEVTEIAEATGSAAEAKRREAVALLAALPGNGYARPCWRDPRQ